ncbi:MAG: ribonuclease E/G, partial [Bacillota bacterium]|nr:ribonuclease E/G [Bacillota bacterium]
MKKIYIERQEKLLRVAIKENDKLIECFTEEENDKPMVGQIYLGKVDHIVNGLKCAFIDVGSNRNCFMYLDNRFKNTDLKKGEYVLVEVIKEDLGNKGAKVTNAVSLPGRYCVLETFDTKINISKKITDENIKSNLEENIIKPSDIGITIRTAGAEADISLINNEIAGLYEKYKQILNTAKYSTNPRLLFSDEGIIDNVLRDNAGDVSCITVNNADDFQHIKEYISDKKDITSEIKLYDDKIDLFFYYGIEKEILLLRNNRVYLSCGGYIIIEKTEAMYVIDVNSGKNIKNSNIEQTSYKTNMEAAKVIAQQIILRNLSGIILIDFIDTEKTSMKNEILAVLKSGFEKDKNKTVIYPFTELNLVQIARRRHGRTIYNYLEEECSSC